MPNAPFNTREMIDSIRKAFHRLKRHPNQKIRILFGVLLITGGILGFLPILGFWMIPLGLILLFTNSPYYWQLRRRYVAWRRKRKTKRINQRSDPG